MEGNQPHDRFFKSMLTRPKVGLALLSERLPPAIARRLAATPPEALSESFVDPKLSASQADLLLRARTRDGKPVYVYCLIEHKSWVDRRVALQLLRYLSRVWDRLARLPEHRDSLPIILPLVLYHGPGRWLAPTRFAHLLDLDDEEQLPLVLDFPFLLIDLGQTPDATLSHQPQLAVALRLLKHGFALPAGDRIDALAWLLSGFANELESMSFALSYINRVHPDVTEEELRLALRRIIPGKEQEMVSKAALQWMEQGRLEGEARGELKGKRATLLRLVQRRFGPLPAALRERVEQASDTQLDDWADRILDAPSLKAVFGPEGL